MVKTSSIIKRLTVFSLTALVFSVLPFQPVFAKPKDQHKALVFVSDGMRQDLMLKYSSEGLMPTYKRIVDKGIVGKNGMIPNVPSNTGPGWTSLLTGASPAVTGVTNNTFHDNTQPFTPYGVSAWGYGVNHAETLAKTADDQGKVVAALAWQAFDTSTIPHGVSVEYYPDWLTGRGIVANYDVPLTWTNVLSPSPILADTKVSLADATGWSNTPQSYSPAKETTFAMNNFSGQAVLNFNVYIFDSSNDQTINYDKVLVSPSKNAVDKVAELKQGQWSNSITESVNDYTGNPQLGGFYTKLINLSGDLSTFRLYYTQVTRIRAVPQTLEDYLATHYGAIMPADYSPYLLGLVDAQTYVEQHTMAQKLLGEEIYPYVLETYQPDLALVGHEWTDGAQHRFTSLCTPGSVDYNPSTASTYCDYIKTAYKSADNMLKHVWDEMPGADVFVTSDHGFTASGKAINANFVLQLAGLYNPTNLSQSKAVAYIAGGTAQIYINLAGRNPNGVVSQSDYESVRQQVKQAFANLGSDKIERILNKEETSSISTAFGKTYNMLNQNTTGDVVVFSKPPYQFDAPTPNQIISDAPISGQHGYVPNGELDRFATFAAYGPDIRKKADNLVVTVLDLAPTVAHVMDINAPAQSQGVVLDIFKK